MLLGVYCGSLGWQNAIGFSQFDDGITLGCRFEQLEPGDDDLALPLAITWRAQRPAHRMRRNHEARDLHRLEAREKCFDRDDDRRNSVRFQQARNMSHGHVTYGSDGDEQRGVNLVLLE